VIGTTHPDGNDYVDDKSICNQQSVATVASKLMIVDKNTIEDCDERQDDNDKSKAHRSEETAVLGAGETPMSSDESSKPIPSESLTDRATGNNDEDIDFTGISQISEGGYNQVFFFNFKSFVIQLK